MRTLLLITLFAVTQHMDAQRMVSASPHPAAGYNRGGHVRPFLYPLAFSDPFYSDYLSSTGYPVASQPPVIVLQVPPAPAPATDGSSSFHPSIAQPLMIELQGDRYVQVSGEEASGIEMIDSQRTDLMSNTPIRQRAAVHAVTAKELARAVLVFRDGRREEVSNYTITGGVLYSSGDYYADGSWTRKIELSSLDLPETVKSNQSRGVKFQLPAAPNEVIVGP